MCFASAHPIRIASIPCARIMPYGKSLPQHTPYGLHPMRTTVPGEQRNFASAHPIRIASNIRDRFTQSNLLCLSTPHTDCIPRSRVGSFDFYSLPQHTPYGLHQHRCTKKNANLCRICCEQVDSFSVKKGNHDCADYFPILFCCLSNLYCH